MRGGDIFSGRGSFRKYFSCAALFLYLLFSFIPVDNCYASTVNVEVGSRAYEDIEFLSAVGLLDTAMIGALPLSRGEVARLVVEAKRKAKGKKSLTKLEAWAIRRLEEEFSEDIEDLKTGNDTVYFKPVREAGVGYLYLDQKDSVYAGQGTEEPKRGEIEAHQKAFTYNMDGIEFGKHNGTAFLNTDGRVKMFSFLLKPLLTWRDPPGDLNFTFQKAYAKFGSKLVIEAGKDSRWWGQGRHGSILLTNNAEPLMLVSISNERPYIIPLIGLFTFDMFLSRLEKDRDFEKPYFLGTRLSFKPVPFFEFGLHRTAIFGGKGAPDYDFGDILSILLGVSSDESTGSNVADQIAGFDMRFHIAMLKADIYWERAEEHVRSEFLSSGKGADIYGIFFADLFGFSMRAEFFDSTRDPGVWYRHEVFTSGYTHKEKVIGHHAGGDADDLFFEVGRWFSDHVNIAASIDLETRGTNQLFVERHRQYVGKALLWYYPLIAECAAGWEDVENPGFTPGSDESYFFSINLKRFF